jgi:hypothetical protein
MRVKDDSNDRGWHLFRTGGTAVQLVAYRLSKRRSLLSAACRVFDTAQVNATVPQSYNADET